MLSQKQFAEFALANRPRASESEGAYGQRLMNSLLPGSPPAPSGFRGSGASRSIPQGVPEEHLQQAVAEADASPFKAGDPEW